MSNTSTTSDDERSERRTLPIERGFPIERINEIASKEGRAKQWYRPIYTMHKWWARRLGCLFRSISLYTLLDDDANVTVHQPGGTDRRLDSYSESDDEIQELIDGVDLTNPETLWPLYTKDVRVDNKRVLDPFMGGGTSLGEASRFGAETVGNDLNPVAWFVTKKQTDAHQTDLDALEDAFAAVQEDVEEEVKQYYRTPCPNGDHDADVMYNLWVKELECNSCGSTVPLFRDYRVGKGRYENDDKYHVLDPYTWEVVMVDDWQSKCDSQQAGETFVPSEGNISRGDYSCPDCGQQYSITDAVEEQGGFDFRLYAIEYYCSHCDKRSDTTKSDVKGYKTVSDEDIELFEAARTDFESSPELHDYVPDVEIPLGIMTDSSAFEGGIGGGHNLLAHGYTNWTDFYNGRQLFALSTILKRISEVDDQNIREFLLLAFSDSLRTNTIMTGYQYGANKSNHIFKTNSFDVPHEPVEGNPWGAKYGLGTFKSIWKMILRGVDYAKGPTERYIENGDTKETERFAKPLGERTSIRCGDARTLESDEKFDLVLTDPPYYDNIIYSEISNFFYVWQRLLLKDDYEWFEPEATPSAESIVANPAQGKGAEEFETELSEAFHNINGLLKDDGALIFTYHHSDSESWGELLQALCAQGFEVTATYPINADEQKFIGGEAVSFDIVVVARPSLERTPISWRKLRRVIYQTARETRKTLEEHRDLSRGDVGVIEMGECFREYSKHHGKVQYGDDGLSAKEVVSEIYGIIQEASEDSATDVFIDLLKTSDPSIDDVTKLCQTASVTKGELQSQKLYSLSGGFSLGTWDNPTRQAYIQERVSGEDDSNLTALDKLQFLRYLYEEGKKFQNYVDKWGVDQEMRDLAGRLADATDDVAYTRVLGDRDVLSYE